VFGRDRVQHHLPQSLECRSAVERRRTGVTLHLNPGISLLCYQPLSGI
jgi:hypothetical protein